MKRLFSSITFLFTVCFGKMFGKKKKVSTPTLQEDAKVDDGLNRENANIIGNELSPQLKMWCLDKAAKMCEQGSFFKKENGIIYCYENNPVSIRLAYNSLISIVASLHTFTGIATKQATDTTQEK